MPPTLSIDEQVKGLLSSLATDSSLEWQRAHGLLVEGPIPNSLHALPQRKFQSLSSMRPVQVQSAITFWSLKKLYDTHHVPMFLVHNIMKTAATIFNDTWDERLSK